jgi:hypothetical protein
MTTTISAPSLTAHDRRRVAVHAGVDDRTVLAFLRGQPMRSTTRARVEEALRALGYLPAPPTGFDPPEAA